MRGLWIALASAGLLTACGGGGGDSNPAPVATVTITSANQDAVARAAAGAVVSLAGAGGGVTADEGSAGSNAALRSFASRVAGAALGDRKRMAAAGRAAPLAVDPIVSACTFSGSITISATDGDNDGLPEAGDTLTMTFANCKESATDNINGTIALAITYAEFTNDGFFWFNGRTTITQLVATEGQRSASLAGDMEMYYRERSATQLDLLLVVGANGLTSSVTTPGLTETIAYDPEFSYNETATYNANTGALVQSSSLTGGGFRSSQLGNGRLILEPQQAVIQLANQVYPSAGVLRVVGNGSALRLVTLSSTTVRIELDANLDGNYEAFHDVDWADLLPTD